MLEWTATGSVRSEAVDHDTTFRIACPWANSTMEIHQNGDVVACAVDYEGSFKVGSVRTATLKEPWRDLGERLRRPHRKRRWGALPEICRRWADWQVAGADYEEEKIPGTRPFWFRGDRALPDAPPD